MEWISVRDRLPEKNGTYLCCEFNKYIDILYFVNDFESLKSKEGYRDYFEFVSDETPGFYEPSNSDAYLLNTGITHWMPLPELPKG